ncbi:MAG: hypothetical protein ACT4OG_08400, partial [Alphaproteobacteria bacterium]
RGGGQAEGARIVAAARAWIGTPYVHQASVKGVGCDCLGLLRGLWRECVGPEPEAMQPYSPDWSEASGGETLYAVLARYLAEIDPREIRAGDIALFRMAPHAPAKHCAIVAEKEFSSPACGGELAPHVLRGRSGEAVRGAKPDRVGGPMKQQKGSLTLIHTRMNKRVSEEPFSPAWRCKLAYAFRMQEKSCHGPA